MKCPKCNTEQPEGTKICTNCGQALISSKPVVSPISTNHSQEPPLDFGSILNRAFKYPWKHKALWFFGVLALLAGGGTGASYNGNPSSSTVGSSTFKNIANLLSKPGFVVGVIVVVVIIVVLIIIALIIGNWGISAIIKGTLRLENGQDITRKEIAKTGKKPIWGLIKLNVLLPIGLGVLIVAIFILGFVVFSVLPKPVGPVLGVVLALLFILALIPIFFYLTVVWPMAGRSVVVDEKKTFAAIQESRQLVKGHYWLSFAYLIVTTLLTCAGNCLGSILFIILLVVTVGLIVAKIYIAAIIVGIFALLGLVFLILVAGYFKAFSETGLTIWWNDLNKIKKNPPRD